MDPLVAKDYIQNCLKIKTKSGAVTPFRLNPAQEKLYAAAKRQQEQGKPVRIIILKARQLGFSTLTEGLIFHGCATSANSNALIVAHREDATANLFRMSKLFYDELPGPLKPMLKGFRLAYCEYNKFGYMCFHYVREPERKRAFKNLVNV